MGASDGFKYQVSLLSRSIREKQYEESCPLKHVYNVEVTAQKLVSIHSHTYDEVTAEEVV